MALVKRLITGAALLTVVVVVGIIGLINYNFFLPSPSIEAKLTYAKIECHYTMLYYTSRTNCNGEVRTRIDGSGTFTIESVQVEVVWNLNNSPFSWTPRNITVSQKLVTLPNSIYVYISSEPTLISVSDLQGTLTITVTGQWHTMSDRQVTLKDSMPVQNYAY